MVKEMIDKEAIMKRIGELKEKAEKNYIEHISPKDILDALNNDDTNEHNRLFDFIYNDKPMIAEDVDKYTVIQCDYCEKPATCNVQLLWMRFNIKYNGYDTDNPIILDDQDPTGDENMHLCEDHFTNFEEGYDLQ